MCATSLILSKRGSVMRDGDAGGALTLAIGIDSTALQAPAYAGRKRYIFTMNCDRLLTSCEYSPPGQPVGLAANQILFDTKDTRACKLRAVLADVARLIRPFASWQNLKSCLSAPRLPWD